MIFKADFDVTSSAQEARDAQRAFIDAAQEARRQRCRRPSILRARLPMRRYWTFPGADISR